VHLVTADTATESHERSVAHHSQQNISPSSYHAPRMNTNCILT